MSTRLKKTIRDKLAFQKFVRGEITFQEYVKKVDCPYNKILKINLEGRLRNLKLYGIKPEEVGIVKIGEE